MNSQEPIIEVGILFAPKISFRFNGIYQEYNTNKLFEGEYHVVKQNGLLLLTQNDEHFFIQ